MTAPVSTPPGTCAAPVAGARPRPRCPLGAPREPFPSLSLAGADWAKPTGLRSSAERETAISGRY